MFFDATKVGANAAVDSLAPRWTVEAHLDGLFDVEGSDTGEPQGTTRPTKALPSADHEGLVAANAATGTDEKALRDHAGVHVQGTGFPWQRGSNVYIAGHRIGYVGTPSFRAFYDPESLEEEDEVILGGPDGETYLYVVYETLEVGSREVGVTLPVPGKSIVSLQTCTLPDYSRRVIVRAERVD